MAISWSFYWLKKRKILDYFLFQQRSQNQESILEIINGVTEMKLNQFENFKTSLQNLKSGIYIIELINNSSEVYRQKIIKK